MEKLPLNQELISRSLKYSASHTPAPTVEQLHAIFSSPNPPPPVTIIICCCDPRIVPEDFFDCGGMDFSIIRNAGGRAGEALRSVICMDHLVGVGAIVVVHHTDCGMTHLTNDYLRNSLATKKPELAAEIGKMEFGEILNLRESVVEDMAIVRDSPFVAENVKVLGFVYDIATGKVEEVAPK